MKVWITKYALTAGIQEREGELCPDHGNMIEVKTPNVFNQYFHSEGKDWHRTREAAVKCANQMRTDKIASLKKSIAKLEGQTFK